MAADWAGLHGDLLSLLANRVKDMEDFIAFRGVCTSWRKTTDNFDVLSPQLPLLMLPDKEEDDDYREFYSLSKGKVSRILYLPEARGRECFPILNHPGWLLTQSHDGLEVSLLNVFSRTQIQLPNQFTFGAYPHRESGIYNSIRNAALSADPRFTSDYVVLIAYNSGSNHLAFWRPGNLNWTELDVIQHGVSNLFYYEGKFYLVDWSCHICIFDIPEPSSTDPTTPPHLESIYLNEHNDQTLILHDTLYYLVQVNDALLLVLRSCHSAYGYSSPPDTFKCQVYEIDTRSGKLKEISSLGNSAIFLGINGATSIDATKFKGVMPNHIYFTDDWYEENSDVECGGGRDMGAYNLEDGKIEPFYPGLATSRISPPTWVIPSLS